MGENAELSLDDVLELLLKEVNWHIEHYNEIDMPFQYKVGFIEGLRHAYNFLIDADVEVISQ